MVLQSEGVLLWLLGEGLHLIPSGAIPSRSEDTRLQPEDIQCRSEATTRLPPEELQSRMLLLSIGRRDSMHLRKVALTSVGAVLILTLPAGSHPRQSITRHTFIKPPNQATAPLTTM